MMGVIFPYTSAQCSYLLAIQDNTKPITVVTGPRSGRLNWRARRRSGTAESS